MGMGTATTVDRRTVSVETAGKMLGLSRRMSYKMAREGHLPILRFGRAIRVPLSAPEKMLVGEWTPDGAQAANFPDTAV